MAVDARRPVRVAYEAGPTGYGLARACEAAGIACVVAAPSRIARAPGDRVKTDRRDAERLVRLPASRRSACGRVPTLVEEAARDLVRAREDARGDLMRTRHRAVEAAAAPWLVYDGAGVVGGHDAWLRAAALREQCVAAGLRRGLWRDAAGESRRDALDQAIVEMAARSRSAAIVGRLCCLRGVECADSARVVRRDRRLAALQRPLDRRLSRPRRLARSRPGAPPAGGDHQDRQQHARRLLVRGRLASPPPAAAEPDAARAAAPASPPRSAHERTSPRGACISAGSGSRRARQALTLVAVAVARELAGWCWSLAVME